MNNQVLKAGENGEGPLRGDRVSVHYVGILAEDGSVFDSSRETGPQFEFTLGKGMVRLLNQFSWNGLVVESVGLEKRG